MGACQVAKQIMCLPSPIDLVLIDKKSSISFRLKFGKQSEEGSISNYPRVITFRRNPSSACKHKCNARCKHNVKVMKIGSPYNPGIAMV